MGQTLLGRFARALVLCPHTDDELGCAGTIVRLIEEGVEVHYVALSRCEESVPKGFAPDVLEHECRACTQCLGVPADHVEVWRFPVRHFPAQRQEILERFVTLNRSFAPELVLLPSSFDKHQDHATVAEEGFRAFKGASMLGYELPQNLISFQQTAFVRLEAAHLDHKVRALASYGSQTFRPYSSDDFIRSLAKVRGVQASATYAEAFEVVRLRF